MDLIKIKAEPKIGNELLSDNGVSMKHTLLDFWRWSTSDILSNATRGRFAEFIVGTAIGLNPENIRDEWDAYELNLSTLLPKNLTDNNGINGASYEIQTAIKRTLNNSIFNSHNFNHQGKEYTIICSEILEVCSDDFANGVLFIIFREGIKYPKDIPEILQIFNRVTANYVSKYNDCINQRIISVKKKKK